MKLRTYILSLLAFGMASWILFHFACIWVWGQFIIYEPNHWILTLETIVMFVIMAFSISCIVNHLRGMVTTKRIKRGRNAVEEPLEDIL